MSKSENDELDKKIRFALNVLTPENYEKVKLDIRSIAVKKYETLDFMAN